MVRRLPGLRAGLGGGTAGRAAVVSIAVMSDVWTNAPVKGGELVILLALADFADDDGACFPAVPTLARKARMTDRNVQRCLTSLAEARLIRIEKGTGPNGVNRYVVLGNRPDAGASASGGTGPDRPNRGNGAGTTYSGGGDNLSPPDAGAGGDVGVTGGVTFSTSGGDAHVTQTVIEPPIEPSEGESAGARGKASQDDQHLDDDDRSSGAAGKADRPSGPATGSEPAAKGGGAASDSDPMADDRKALKAIKREHPHWPTFSADSRAETEKQFIACAPADRGEGLALWRAYVTHVTKTLGRGKLCAMSTYWRERRWQQLPADLVQRAKSGAAEPAKPSPSVRPYGPVWAAMRMAALTGAVVPGLDGFRPTNFQAGLIERGQATVEGLAIDRAVGRLDSEAEQRRSPVAPDWALGLKEAMEAVPVGSPLYHRWRAVFVTRGWPFQRTPLDVVFLPKVTADDFEAALTLFVDAVQASGAPIADRSGKAQGRKRGHASAPSGRSPSAAKGKPHVERSEAQGLPRDGGGATGEPIEPLPV